MSIVFQSGLGAITQTNNAQERSVGPGGTLRVARVTRVHHKRYSADVRFTDNNQLSMADPLQEGRNGCHILTRFAGYDDVAGKPYGESVPVEVGDTVLVAVLDDYGHHAVILGSLHDTTEPIGMTNIRNMLTSAYPLDDPTEMYRHTTMTRTQDFSTIDGLGDFELASHTKAFIAGISNREVDDECYGWSDLSVRDSRGRVPTMPETASRPMKIIASIRRFFLDDMPDNLRVVIDGARSAIRIARMARSDHRLSSISMSDDGGIHLVARRDTESWTADSSQESSVSIEPDGSIVARAGSSDSSSTVTLSPDGSIVIGSTSDITVNANLSVKGSITASGEVQGKKGV